MREARRGHANLWSAGLCDDARDGAVMPLQLVGHGADAPVFGMVVAQNLRFQFRGKGQGGAPLRSGGTTDGTRRLCRKPCRTSAEQRQPQK